ncbi:hypothetical protein [Roseivivax isoporae]|uniref:Uncharacterized protein n=1 Tax=Roseivivax isoporae LMG 25204 TaxID=1449351 RepID=X7F5H2_9RHOB|nr:hypothetical protein [Roseivivax isoporae]ETX28010.1 hypothetical protein RISW2_10360 [Roseivivax isoporae LMG 25204]
MSFLRPGARQAIRRWREALAGAGAAALGAWFVLGAGGLLGVVGIGLILGGGALAVAGVQRARFRTGGGGQGIVQVSEGRIAYFGPLDGGVVDLSELESLAVDPTGRPLHWVLSRTGAQPLRVPVDAEGADALFDAFAALPGLRTERMLRAIEAPGRHVQVIWQRPDLRRTAIGLH